MPILLKKTQLAAKVEAAEGTEETLAVADALRVSDFNFEPDIEQIARNLVDSDLSGYKSLSGKRSGKIGFNVELKGSGAAGTAPEWGELMKACGMGETVNAGVDVQYDPISDSIPSMTLAGYLDGMKSAVWGARGDMGLDVALGQPGKMNFSFLGADFSVTDVAMLAGITYDSTVPPVALNVSLTIGAYSFKINTLSLKLQNELQLRSDINKESGHFSTLITGRRVIGSMDPELIKVADEDIFGKWRSGAEGALSITLGSTAGNIIEITAPKCRYTKLGLGDRGSMRTLGVDFELNRNSGNDELKIKLT